MLGDARMVVELGADRSLEDAAALAVDDEHRLPAGRSEEASQPVDRGLAVQAVQIEPCGGLDLTAGDASRKARAALLLRFVVRPAIFQRLGTRCGEGRDSPFEERAVRRRAVGGGAVGGGAVGGGAVGGGASAVARPVRSLTSAARHLLTQPVFWSPAAMPCTVASRAWSRSSSRRPSARHRRRSSTWSRLIGST